jgi:hypothetical protein
MELIPVESGMVDAVACNPQTKKLHVIFSSGKTCTYMKGPQEEFDRLLAAESKGQYMCACIIEVYPFYKGFKRRR